MQPVGNSMEAKWLIHDSWSQGYVGTRHLVHEVIPAVSTAHKAEAEALCQLALVGANHLMEIALYKLLLPYASTGQLAPLNKALLEKAGYQDMIARWVTAIAGKSVNFKVQPFKSTDQLRKKRNNTIHKTSAPVTEQMAKSALYSAVKGSEGLFARCQIAFPYQDALLHYPLHNEPWFSDV